MGMMDVPVSRGRTIVTGKRRRVWNKDLGREVEVEETETEDGVYLYPDDIVGDEIWHPVC